MGTLIKMGKPTQNIKSSLEYIYRNGQLPDNQRHVLNSSTDINMALTQHKQYQKLFNDTHKIEGHHIVQSFSNDIQDIQLVQQAGQELIQKISNKYPNYAIHMATHTDTDNLHNHFIIENLNLKTGKGLNNNKQFLYDLRNWNNEIAQQLNIDQSAFTREKYHKKDYEYNDQGKQTHREEIKHAILDAKNNTSSFNEFKSYLSKKHDIQIFFYDRNRRIGYHQINTNFQIREEKLGTELYGYQSIKKQIQSQSQLQPQKTISSTLNHLSYEVYQMSSHILKAQQSEKEKAQQDYEQMQREVEKAKQPQYSQDLEL